MDIARRDETDSGAHRELGERVVARVVERCVVVGELDEHAFGAERLDKACKLAGRCGRPVRDERLWHRAVAAPGEDEPVSVVRFRQGVERVGEAALFAP